MPSKIQVDQIAGATGSTVTLPSGQTLDLSSGTVNLPSSALSALNASNLTSGTVPSARLSLTSSDLPTVPTTKGGTGLTTIGTANQVLRVNSGATALEFYTPTVATSDFVKLASQTTASASSISFDGYFSSTYDNYIIYVNTYNNATSNQYPQVRFRRSNADVTASNYRFQSARVMKSSGGQDIATGEAGWDVSYIRLNQDSDNSGVTAHNYTIQIPNPLDATSYPSIIFDGTSTNAGNGDYYRRYVDGSSNARSLRCMWC